MIAFAKTLSEARGRRAPLSALAGLTPLTRDILTGLSLVATLTALAVFTTPMS